MSESEKKNSSMDSHHKDDKSSAVPNKPEKKYREKSDTTKIYTIAHESPEETQRKDKLRKKKRRKQRRLKIWTAVLILLIIVNLLIGTVGLIIVNRMVASSPELNVTDFIGEESSKIYDDKGDLVTEVGVYMRENITYDKLPESVVDAFLAIEDSRFFTHFGFDIPRFTKAAIENLRYHNLGQGGSTFTMQLVKNTYFTVDSATGQDSGTERTRSIEYKVQQIYLAIKLEKLLSKKEIFQLYLNKLNFGGNIRGIQRASRYYFGKNISEVSLPEAAMLAGIVNLPNRYNPYDYLDFGTTRRNEVLNQMVNHGYISQDECNLAKSIKVEDLLVGENRAQTEESEYQGYLDVVLNEAIKMTGSDPVYRGMQIYTYLNRDMQTAVEDIQNGNYDNISYPDDYMQTGIICLNNQNGGIVAIGGGKNYDGARLLNRATMNYKQPGSSVKPVVSYALAFEYLGYSLDEILVDKPITYPGESMVLRNANGQYSGDVTIKEAVGRSLNIPAILTLEKVVDKIGKDPVVAYMNSIGFSRVTSDNFHFSFAIGGTWFETTPEELAGAHAMLMNGGVYNEPHTIEKLVLTRDGSTVYPQNQNKQVLSSGSAWLSAQLMYNNIYGYNGNFNFMQILKRDYQTFAKTGTTDWGTDGIQYGIPEGAMKDKWMVSETSQYTNAVWVGYDKAEKGVDTYFQGWKSLLNIPGRINSALIDKEAEVFGTPGDYERPSDVEDVQYVYGTYPHVMLDDSMDPSVAITSQVSAAGLKAQPLVTREEYLSGSSNDADSHNMSATYDQYGMLRVSWGGSNGVCSGQRDISLHDEWNDIDMWGACLVDLSWLTGSGNFWATVYCDDTPIGQISSTNGYYNGYAGSLYGTVKVCGGYSGNDGSYENTCTIAKYSESQMDPNAVTGYYDENGNWVPYQGGYIDANGNWVDTTQNNTTSDYSQYGYWDANGSWVGQGYWDASGFHAPN